MGEERRGKERRRRRRGEEIIKKSKCIGKEGSFIYFLSFFLFKQYFKLLKNVMNCPKNLTKFGPLGLVLGALIDSCGRSR